MKKHILRSNKPLEDMIWTLDGPIGFEMIKENELPIPPKLWIEEIEEKN